MQETMAAQEEKYFSNDVDDQHESSEGNISVVCEFCGKNIEKLKYKRHLRNVHTEKRTEVCKICGKEFTNMSNFQYHMAHHGDERPWLCNECPKTYKTKIDLVQHQRTHERARDPYECDECHQRFSIRSAYNTHMRTHRASGPNPCPECGKVFVNLYSHIEQVHKKIRKHECVICNKTFGKRSGLERHVETVHEKLKNWRCDICGKCFGEKSRLTRHRKIHSRPLTFPVPDSSDSGTEAEDKEVMLDKKRYMCGKCKKTYHSRSSLKRHKALVHQKQRPFLCQWCSKTFGERSILLRHIRRLHKDEVTDENEAKIKIEDSNNTEKGDFACTACGKHFKTKWGHDGHVDGCKLKRQKAFNEEDSDSDDSTESEDTDDDDDDCDDRFDSFDDEDIKPEIVNIREMNIKDDDEPNSSIYIKVEPFEEDYTTIVIEKLENSKEVEQDFLNIKEEIEDEDNDNDIFYDNENDDHLYSSDDENAKNNDLLPPNKLAASTVKLETFNDVQNTSEFLNKVAAKKVISKATRSEIKSKENQKGEMKITCKICSATFKQIRYYQEHFLSVHAKEKFINCYYCHEKFNHRAQRSRHLKLAHPEVYEDNNTESTKVLEIQECELCNAIFNNLDELMKHLDKVHKSESFELNLRSCEFCQRTYSNYQELLTHVQSSHKNSSYSCDKCTRNFSFKRFLTQHFNAFDDCTFENEIDDKSERKCNICNKTFKRIKYLENHCVSDHKLQLFECKICQRKFSFKQSMDRHIQTVHKKEFKCTKPDCEESFSTNQQLQCHISKVHIGIKKDDDTDMSAQCGLCEKIFKSKRSLYTHKKVVHEKIKWGVKQQCKLCMEIFTTKYQKTKHWSQVHHNGVIKLRKCHLCLSEFKLSTDFKLHIAESHIGNFICQICGHYFHDQTSYFLHCESHKKIEQSLKPFYCDICGHRTHNKTQIKIHMIKHTGETQFICDFCGKTFKYYPPLLYHKKVEHSSEPREFQCSYCEKTFVVKRERMLHERTHTGERPYQCNICNKSFLAKPSYVLHMRTHDGAHQCKTCKVYFPSTFKLRQHELTTHPEEFPYRCHDCGRNFKSLDLHKKFCSKKYDMEMEIEDY